MAEVFKQYAIEEHRVAGKPLGRHVLHDPRSRNYEAAEAVSIANVTHVANSNCLPLTQTRGSCTAEALVGALDMRPNVAHLHQDVAEHLYNNEIVLEGGDPAVDDPGGTGVLVCKAAKTMRLITSYAHTFSLVSALRALMLQPIMVGTNWYDSMDEPKSNGLVEITPGAQVRGGHEYVARGIHVDNKTVWFWNSWGLEFGIGGRFCMTYATLEQLLSEDGDVTVPHV